MKRDLELIKQALEEHLSAINENTTEVQAIFDYLHQLEVKVDHLTERLDQLQLAEPCKKDISPLNEMEKQIFLALYTEESALSFKEIALKANIPESLVAEAVSILIQKGVPLQRSYFNDHLFVKLSPEFKELQAKQKIINLSLQNFMD